MKFKLAATVCAALMAVSSSGMADEQYPTKPVRVVLATPGGTTDNGARIFAEALSRELKQTFIIEPKAGAGGSIGMREVSRAQPDGYTLLIGSTGLAAARIFMKEALDPTVEITPVSLLMENPLTMLSPSTAPWKNFKEFVAETKSKPGRYNFGHIGAGTTQLYPLMVHDQMGVNLVSIPFKNSSDFTIALLRGDTHVAFYGIGRANTDVKSGKARALAVTGSERAEQFPDVPTFDELGVKGLDSSWIGLFAPNGTPKPILDRLHQAAVKTLKTGHYKDVLLKADLVPVASSPQEFKATLTRQTRDWGAAAKKANITAQ